MLLQVCEYADEDITHRVNVPLELRRHDILVGVLEVAEQGGGGEVGEKALNNLLEVTRLPRHHKQEQG